MPAAFFIIGTERSGSNLLRLLLTSHSAFAVPHPPHLVRYLKGSRRNWPDLVDAARQIVETHIYPWDVPIEWSRVESECPVHDIHFIQWFINDLYAAHKGKPLWGEKSTFLVEEVPLLHETFPSARFLWLYRDPRDVAVSSRRSVFSATHPVHVAELWRDQQRLAARWEALFPDHVVRIPYERLVAEPLPEMERVCGALGVPFEPAMLDYFTTPEARRSSDLSESWARTGEAPRTDHVGRWRVALEPEEIDWIEGICSEGMGLLGYAPTGAATPPVFTAWDRARFALAATVENLRIEGRSLRKDKNVWRRWRRAWVLRRLGWRG